MKGVNKFFLAIFGQDDKRVISTKTVISYLMILLTVVLWLLAFFKGKAIPHIAELISLDMVVFISYFGVSAAKVVADKIGGNGTNPAG